EQRQLLPAQLDRPGAELLRRGADEDDAAAEGGECDRLLVDGGRADALDDDVGAVASARGARALDRVVAARLHERVRAEPARELELLLAAADRDDAGAEPLAELHRVRA